METKNCSKDCDSSTEKLAESIEINNLSSTTVTTLSVLGMDCADEVTAIQKQLQHPKIAKISTNLMTSQVVVEHAPELERSEIVKLLNKAGVRVNESNQALSFTTENKTRVLLVSLSGLLLLIGLGLEWFFSFPKNWLLILYLLSTLAGGVLIFPKAVRSLRQFSLDMNILMTIAVIGAFIIKEYSEGTAVIFLFSLAEMLEAFSVSRARKAIREVLSITPQVAHFITELGVVATPVDQITIGQKIIIRPGDRVPLDGTVVEGVSYVNQAPLTGESQPVAKSSGDNLLAGTVNENSTLTMTVTHNFKDTKIAHVIKLVESAQSQKAPAQLFVDKFSKIYTPAVTVIALLVMIIPPILFSQPWSLWFYRALVFLVIACPCALVIATPVSVVSALAALAKNGVLVKGGIFLESLGKLKSIAMDKTGTITEGKPQVVSKKEINSKASNEFLTTILALESLSTHPLAKAIVEYGKSQDLPIYPVSEYKVIPGKGVEGIINSYHYFAGNHKFAHELGLCTPEIEEHLQKMENEAQSVVIVGRKLHKENKGEILGILGLADKPRAGVQDAILKLYQAGINEIVMLSGDNQRTVNAIGKLVGIKRAHGDLLPEDKVTEVRKLLLQYQFVAMVGDGINDAPALAQATVGIAMGAQGTDVAIETADIALMTDDLHQLARAIIHGQKALRVIYFNIAFALVTKAAFVVLGVFGYSSLWLAVAADMGASLLVIGNSMRLLDLDS